MGKVSDFFSMTRRERVGTLAVLLMLAVALLFSYCGQACRDRAEASGDVPSEQVIRELNKAVQSKPLSRSKKDAATAASKARKEKHGRKHQVKPKHKKTVISTKAVKRGNKDMDEMPSF